MSMDVWCKSDDNMQEVIAEDDAMRFCRVSSEEGGGGGGGGGGGSNNPAARGNITMDKDEKRMRREIANSNERRRMQSINAGFQSLRQMLPHHEGEKLSKAAILQQTAEYIYALEQEKTRLLSQNCQLKRLLDQQDHNGAVAAAELQQATTQTATAATTVLTATATATASPAAIAVVPATTTTVAAIQAPTGQAAVAQVATVAKKRKIDAIMTVQPVSDSSDEGLGSMSPEPVSLMQVVNNATGQTIMATAVNGRACATFNVSAKDYLDMKHQLEIERRQKTVIEERLKALERQIYPARVLYQDHPDINDPKETYEEITVTTIQKPITAKIGKEMESVQLIELESVIPGKKQLVVCKTEGIEEVIPAVTVKPAVVPLKEDKVFVKRSRSRSPTIETVVTLPPKKNRYPTILEAAIKAEPKVEVERIDSPSSIVVTDDHLSHLTSSSKLVTSQQQQAASRINTCRHNLETIVEAIRHLEGDAFDAVVPGGPAAGQVLQNPRHIVQEVPLALTTSSKQKERDHRQSQLEPFLKFRTAPAAAGTCSSSLSSVTSSSVAAASASPNASSVSNNPAIVSVSITPSNVVCSSPSHSSSISAQQTASQILQQHQQCRPGVIVVKQNS
ncbi:uncharacterized protein LOC128741432 isoform X2 [Sabethes cyaneus]|uniref:uncharacterized protein LOC128741432 isoform X2 n=1 Tax=Sabethes cyaneus TaxID=53552 RepID=UPI00237DBCE1|nr:uncharacterized protein LOC128741432 isoform X2 [Sabethes cyaneus]